MNTEFAAELLKATMFRGRDPGGADIIGGADHRLAISIFQSVTSIQEQTLTFVPKALGIVPCWWFDALDVAHAD